MSASATSQWEFPTHQFELAQRQARVFGCLDDTIENIMECFKTVMLTKIYSFIINIIIT